MVPLLLTQDLKTKCTFKWKRRQLEIDRRRLYEGMWPFLIGQASWSDNIRAPLAAPFLFLSSVVASFIYDLPIAPFSPQ